MLCFVFEKKFLNVNFSSIVVYAGDSFRRQCAVCFFQLDSKLTFSGLSVADV